MWKDLKAAVLKSENGQYVLGVHGFYNGKQMGFKGESPSADEALKSLVLQLEELYRGTSAAPKT